LRTLKTARSCQVPLHPDNVLVTSGFKVRRSGLKVACSRLLLERVEGPPSQVDKTGVRLFFIETGTNMQHLGCRTGSRPSGTGETNPPNALVLLSSMASFPQPNGIFPSPSDHLSPDVSLRCSCQPSSSKQANGGPENVTGQGVCLACASRREFHPEIAPLAPSGHIKQEFFAPLLQFNAGLGQGTFSPNLQPGLRRKKQAWRIEFSNELEKRYWRNDRKNLQVFPLPCSASSHPLRPLSPAPPALTPCLGFHFCYVLNAHCFYYVVLSIVFGS
jgi:hypothetical protein